MVTVLALLSLALGCVFLVSAGLDHERHELAERARRKAFVKWQQQQAERRVQRITHAAFNAMLFEARQRHEKADPSCEN